MATASTTVDEEIQCILCMKKEMKDGEQLFLLSCCKRGMHQTCLKEKFPALHLVTCPKCHCFTQVHAQVIQRDKFSPTDSDKIELCYLKHHAVNAIPMTAKEIHGLRVSLNVRGFRAMRHVSHRVFIVGLAFWFPLTKEKLCEWEGIVCRLSLGLLWSMVSEMRHRYALRVERDGRGDVFHHLGDHLLEVSTQDEGIAARDYVVRTCSGSGGECKECQGFVTVFDGQRFTDQVAMANRAYLYERVGKELYNSFVQLMKKKTNNK